MKRISAILLFCIIFSTPSYSRDMRGLEDIIKSILDSEIEGSIEEKEEETKKPLGEESSSQYMTNRADNEKMEEKKEQISIPSLDRTLLETGLELFNAHNYDHALSKFKELKMKYPQSPLMDSSTIWIAKIYIDTNKWDDARDELLSISENSGEYPTAVFQMGEIEMKRGYPSAAIEFYYRVSSQFPNHHLADDALLVLGNIYINEKKGNKALQTLMRLIKYYRDRETIDDAYFYLGKLFERDLMLRDFEIAIKLYKLFLKKSNEERALHFRYSPLKERVEGNLKQLEAILMPHSSQASQQYYRD
ncbi:MAG: hypothetical protein SVZ03_02900 [Spirochaetota bacterium]|nr:hypothetical protein [Spirochaetota bacterium]